ncbi:hypothetical protein DLAC_10737 [Tieghemostelium lacteum]|uniref:Uncharacterized protein n=1 Tax=Tieghemostelium lacteum TaxID=361077 RepID=A0A151Z446_TIELA|nr:hypothetical protein DLAC_10737 [Tieghemostelium lacteum]|eukprot:KYQ88715.1 hypothetical protein DLAC_10737 [Tieghemostelium lacteum]
MDHIKIFSEPSLDVVYLCNNKCIFCGNNCFQPNIKTQCQLNIDNSIEFQAEALYEWASKGSEHTVVTEPTNNALTNGKHNYLLLLFSIASQLNKLTTVYNTSYNHQKLYNKFLGWVNSPISKQRLISYVFIMYSDNYQPTLDLVIDRMIVDIQIFRILGAVDRTNRFSFIIDNYKPAPNKQRVERISQSLLSETDSEKLKLIDYLSNFIEFKSFSFETFSKLANKGLVNVVGYMPDIKEIDSKQPIEFYRETILMCYKKYRTKNIFLFYQVYTEKFSEFIINHLKNVLLDDKLVYNVTEHNRERVMIEYLDFLNLKEIDIILRNRIDWFIIEIIKKDNGQIHLASKVSNIEPYFDSIASIEHLNLLSAFSGISVNQFSGCTIKKEKFYQLLKTCNHIEAILLIGRFFTTNDDIDYCLSLIGDLSLLAPSSNRVHTLLPQFESTIGFKEADGNVGLQSLRIKWFVTLMDYLHGFALPSTHYVIDRLERLMKENAKVIMKFLLGVNDSGVENMWYNIFFRDSIARCLFESDREGFERLLEKFDLSLHYNDYDSIVRSNIMLITDKYIKLEIDKLKISTFSYTYGYMASKHATCISKDVPILPHNLFTNFELLDQLFDHYDDTPEKPLTHPIYCFCELSLFVIFEINDQIADNTNLLRDYLDDVTNLYSLATPINTREKVTQLCDYLVRHKNICSKSKLFTQYMVSLSDVIFDHLDQTRLSYHFLKERRLAQKDTSIVELKPFPPLPSIILSKILHFIYYDPTVHSLEKVDLALVSWSFFNICSKIISDDYYDDNLFNYIPTYGLNQENIDSKYCLYKNYPRLIDSPDLAKMPMEVFDQLIYHRLESLIISLDNESHQCDFSIITQNTNLKKIEFVIVVGSFNNMESLVHIVKQSPQVTNLSFTCFDNLLGFGDLVRDILLLEMPKLVELFIFWSSGLTITENDNTLSFNDTISKLKKPPIMNISLANYTKFDGFHKVGIRLTEDFDMETFIHSHQASLSSATHQIRFIQKDIHLILPLLDYVIKHHHTKHISFCLDNCPIEPISIEFIQSIFDKMDKCENIQNLSLSWCIFARLPVYSLLIEEQWRYIDLKRLKYTNTFHTKFFQTWQK